MTSFELVLLLLVGVVSGFLNVMAGGGSMLTVPLMIFMGIPGHVANGTNRIGILLQNLTAVTAFYQKGFSNFKLSLSLAAFTIPGAVMGAYLASHIEGKDFNRLLVVLMIIVMIMMATGNHKDPSKRTEKISPKRLLSGHLLMIAAGFWGGLIQIGVGFILMPILHRVMGMDLVTTNSHKVFIALSFSIAALLVFNSQLELLWSAGIALAIGNSIGGWFATSFQIKQGVDTIKWILNIVIIVFIIKLLFFQN